MDKIALSAENLTKIYSKDNSSTKNILALNNLGEYNHEIGNENLSISYYNKALEYEPTNLRSKWLLMNTMPIIYKDFEKINYFNEHFEKRLSELEKLFDNDINLEKKQILNALNSSTNFYLHYQGKDITGFKQYFFIRKDWLVLIQIIFNLKFWLLGQDSNLRPID